MVIVKLGVRALGEVYYLYLIGYCEVSDCLVLLFFLVRALKYGDVILRMFMLPYHFQQWSEKGE